MDEILQSYTNALSIIDGSGVNVKDSISKKEEQLVELNRNTLENQQMLNKIKERMEAAFTDIDTQTSFVMAAISTHMGYYNQIYDTKSKGMLEKLNKVVQEKLIESLNKEVEVIQKLKEAEDFELQQIIEIKQGL